MGLYDSTAGPMGLPPAFLGGFCTPSIGDSGLEGCRPVDHGKDIAVLRGELARLREEVASLRSADIETCKQVSVLAQQVLNLCDVVIPLSQSIEEHDRCIVKLHNVQVEQQSQIEMLALIQRAGNKLV